MKKENLFYLLLIATVIIIRIGVFIFPEVNIGFFNITIHHFWFGIILLTIGLVISKNKKYLKILFCAVGGGLIVDQLIFIIFGAGTDVQYWALTSLLGAIIITIGIFPIREKITDLICKK